MVPKKNSSNPASITAILGLSLVLLSSPLCHCFLPVHPTNILILPTDIYQHDNDAVSPPNQLYESLYPSVSKRPWTMGILTSGFPPQQLLVPLAKFVTFQLWRLLLNELVAHDNQGRFLRESFLAGNATSLDLTPNKYRLYLGNPCPWCHRVRATVAVLGLEQHLPITALIDDADKATKGGWILPMDKSNSDMALPLRLGDLAGVYNYCYRDILSKGQTYQGRCTAPLLVDAHLGTIVSNESNQIMLLLNDYARRQREEKQGHTHATTLDLRPRGLEQALDHATQHWFHLLWNAAYRCGFATSQLAYDEAASDILQGLREMDELLASRSFLMGEALTEVDLKNFAWVTRHDHAYTGIFQCPGGRIVEYPNIANWVKRMVRDYPVLMETVELRDACGSYYRQLFMKNFGRIVPYIPSMEEWIGSL